jgi:hypothetical protein
LPHVIIPSAFGTQLSLYGTDSKILTFDENYFLKTRLHKTLAISYFAEEFKNTSLKKRETIGLHLNLGIPNILGLLDSKKTNLFFDYYSANSGSEHSSTGIIVGGAFDLKLFDIPQKISLASLNYEHSDNLVISSPEEYFNPFFAKLGALRNAENNSFYFSDEIILKKKDYELFLKFFSLSNPGFSFVSVGTNILINENIGVSLRADLLKEENLVFVGLNIIEVLNLGNTLES